jgi:beta-galactosidase
VLHLFPHWNWKGREGHVISVMCYTNCDTVELIVNGKSFGTKGYEFPKQGMFEDYGHYPPRARALRTTSDLHLEWDVPYEPGTVEAIGKRDGKVVAQEQLTTTGEPAAIEIAIENPSPAADGRDVSHLTMKVVDSNGRVVPTAANEITLDIEGPARLIGVDNGNPVDHDGFKINHVKAFNGLCLAIVQATGEAGTIRVKAQSPGLTAADATLTSVGSAPAAIR